RKIPHPRSLSTRERGAEISEVLPSSRGKGCPDVVGTGEGARGRPHSARRYGARGPCRCPAGARQSHPHPIPMASEGGRAIIAHTLRQNLPQEEEMTSVPP